MSQRSGATLRSFLEMSGGGSRSLPLEGLRGLAIILVFVSHVEIVFGHALTAPGKLMIQISTQIGETGVELFFLLSGYLIYRTCLRPNIDLGRFLLRRVQRIYPAFIVVFAIYLLIAFVLGRPARMPAEQPEMLLYVLENLLLIPGIADIPALIPSAWSLSYEFVFYLTFPLICIALRLYDWPARRRCAFWLSLTTAHLAVALLPASRFAAIRYFGGSSIRISMFISGIIVYECVNSKRVLAGLTHLRQSFVVIIAAIAMMLFTFLEALTIGKASHFWQVHDVLRIALLFIAYVSLALITLPPGAILGKLFSHTSLRWTGNLSYSIYLIHGLVLDCVRACFGILRIPVFIPLVSGALILFLAVVGTLFAAAALFVCIERPLSLAGSQKTLRCARA